MLCVVVLRSCVFFVGVSGCNMSCVFLKCMHFIILWDLIEKLQDFTFSCYVNASDNIIDKKA